MRFFNLLNRTPDLEILGIYAKKFEFTPRVRKEPVFDSKEINGTKRGLVESVRIDTAVETGYMPVRLQGDTSYIRFLLYL